MWPEPVLQDRPLVRFVHRLPQAPLPPGPGDDMAALPGAIMRGSGPLAAFLREHSLHAVFQPIVKLDGGQTHAHEALVRGPAGSPYEFPDALSAPPSKRT